MKATVEARGTLQIAALARKLAISQDPLENRFRREVGATPKQLASLLRLRHAIEAYRPDVPLTQLAADAGYFAELAILGRHLPAVAHHRVERRRGRRGARDLESRIALVVEVERVLRFVRDFEDGAEGTKTPRE